MDGGCVRIAVLTQEYRMTSKTDPAQAKTLLGEIAVLCSYIKRRKHLTLLADRDYKVAVSELERAVSESLQTLKLLHVRCTLYMESGDPMLSGRTAAAIFDFYEQVIEADLEHLQSVQVSLTNAGTLRFSLYLCCKSDLSALADRPGVRYESEGEDDYQCILFFPEGGAP